MFTQLLAFVWILSLPSTCINSTTFKNVTSIFRVGRSSRDDQIIIQQRIIQQMVFSWHSSHNFINIQALI